MSEKVLVISQNPSAICDKLQNVGNKYDFDIVVAVSGIAGLEVFEKTHPCLVLVEEGLPDMFAMSFSAIMKDSVDKVNCTIYVIGMTKYMENAKADFIFPAPYEISAVCQRVTEFFDKRNLLSMWNAEVERAKESQLENVPQGIKTEEFSVTRIYSPYSGLSGDGIDYWFDQQNSLYGFIFDCPGHDLVSFTQTGEIRVLMKTGCKMFQMGHFSELGDVMKQANESLFDLHGIDTIPVAAIVFKLDFNTKEVTYCPAGITEFFVKKMGESLQTIKLHNRLIGYKVNTDFKTDSCSFADAEQIVFGSDGLSDLLFANRVGVEKAKHDDVSAIIINLHHNDKDVHNEHPEIKKREED